LYNPFLRFWKKWYPRFQELAIYVNSLFKKSNNGGALSTKAGTRLAEGLPISIHGLEVSKVAKVLQDHGYQCSVLEGLKGGSGENHIFDFVGRREGERVAIMGFDSPNLVEMVKLRVKTLDSNPTFTVVVLQSKDPNLRELAREYGYLIVDNDDSVYEELEAVMKAL
jgi:hypothetical protein